MVTRRSDPPCLVVAPQDCSEAEPGRFALRQGPGWPPGHSAVVLLLLLLAGRGGAVRAEQQTVRTDFTAPTAFEARPSWYPSPGRHAFRQEGGVGIFEATEPHNGMKWVLPAKIDLGRHPWLRVRYRATHVTTASADYVLWLSAGRKGTIVLRLCDLIADGKWHVATMDTRLAGYARAADRLAVQVTSDGHGHARLELDWIEFTSRSANPTAARTPLPDAPTFARRAIVRDGLRPSVPRLSGTAVGKAPQWPRLFVNERPTPPVGWFGWWFMHRPPKASLRNLRAAGLDICFTDVRADDAAEALARIRQIVSFNPNALVVLRTKLDPPRKWLDRHPEQRSLCGDGSPGRGVSFASTPWRDETGAALRAFVRELQASDFADHILGYHLCGGISAEWMHWECQSTKAYDFSEPMVRAFRRWLRERYGSVGKLRAAWHRAEADFDTVRVPTLKERRTATLGLFRDPLTQQSVIDYYQCLSDVNVETIHHFTGIAREEAPRALIGVFYGYLGQSTEHAHQAGHCSLLRLLQSPDIDFIASPLNYYARPATESPVALGDVVLAHNRLFFNEADSRIYLNPPKPQGHEHTLWIGPDKATVLARIRRSFCYAMSHGAGLWWMFVDRGERYADPDVARLLAELQQQARRLEAEEHRSVAEVVVLVSDHPYFGARGLILGHLWAGLAHSGAPYEVRLVSELPSLPDYDVYVFPNAWYLSPSDRANVADVIRSRRKTAVWMLAPGVVGEKGMSLANVEAITGIRVRHDQARFEGVIPHASSADHQPWGIVEPHGGGTIEPIPTFFVEDEDVEVLFDHASNGRPAIARRTKDGWTSVYSAAPFLPADVWAGIFGDAGVHLYAKPGTVIYADNRVVAAYTEEPGEHVVRFPEKTRLLDPVTGQAIDPRTRQTRFAATGPTTSAWLTEKP